MNPFEALVAVLRAWPNTADRMERLARANNVPLAALPKEVVDTYYEKWANSIAGGWLSGLTDDELAVRFAYDERALTECPKDVAQIDRDELVERLEWVQKEIARRGFKSPEERLAQAQAERKQARYGNALLTVEVAAKPAAPTRRR